MTNQEHLGNKSNKTVRKRCDTLGQVYTIKHRAEQLSTELGTIWIILAETDLVLLAETDLVLESFR